MKRIRSIVLIFLQILIFVNAKNEGFYSIVAPGTIQSNSQYSVSVTVHKSTEPVTIKLSIVGSTYNKTETIDVEPSRTELVNFEVPALKSGNFKLETEGTKGLIFKNETELIFKSRDPKVYIQTDKATYKPGDLVQYRILVLDELTRPAKLDVPLKLGFKDAADNFIKQINDIKLNRGVYSGEFQLSEQPNLGDWTMEVTLGPNEDDSKTEKKFEVAKYVLPKFSVDIEAAKDIAYNEPLKITVRSKYTYGKPVKGQATVTIDSRNGQGRSEKVIEVDGKGHVEFNLEKDLNMQPPNDRFFLYSDFYNPPISILAVMTEEYTGNKQNKSATVTVHNSRYNIEIPDQIYDFVPNKSFEYKVYVKNLDGSPVQDSKYKAELKIDQQYYPNLYTEVEGSLLFTSDLDKNGMAVFKVTIPTAGYYNNVRVTYQDKTSRLPTLSSRLGPIDVSPKDDDEDVGPLKLVKKTDKLKVHKHFVVEVKSNENIPYIVFAIVARGNIVKYEHVNLPENVKSYELKVKATNEMAPESHLYVYFVTNGDLKFQEMTLNFPKEFNNKIQITGPEQVAPGDEVTLNIETDPNSFVGLLGVDQSVLLLKSGNDLDSEQIWRDLSSYDSQTPYVRGYGEYPGRSSGLVTLTNANYPFNTGFYPPIFRRPPGLPGIPGPGPVFFLQAAQPAAFGGGSGGAFSTTALSSGTIEPKIRKEFIENWIFYNINNTDENGLASLTKAIPDTITSWVVSGFSLNEESGFGITANPTNITVFQPFFISTNLPYSVKRGEVISIPVVVFNYMDKAHHAEVTMENTDGEYDFTEVSNEIEEVVLEDKQRTKRELVPSNAGKSFSFMIRPNKVGDITLKIRATTHVAGDVIHQKLKVEPEGVTHYGNEAVFISPSNDKPFEATLKAAIPKEAVLDSEYLEFSVVGDILGPTIKNIDGLVRMPYGCGEQNMVNFVPNILVLHYLEAMKREMPTVVQKAKSYMEVGYQRELTYKHKNGAYSAFGEGSSEPSSWLTAYVARSFIQAKRYITIDQAVINDALSYLVSTQQESGQFKQTGRLFHPSHQNDVGFTAFALLAFLEDKDISNKYQAEIEKGMKYLADNIEKENDTYALAIAMLTLKKAQHESACKLMRKLETLAQAENGLKWWTKSSKDTSNDIEITSYILQAYVYSEPAGKLLPIIKWLIKNRNSLGGFDSTQDTVVGLQALIRFAEKYVTAGDGKASINFKAQNSKGKELTKGSFAVDRDNALVLQTHVLPKSSRQVTLKAEGSGSSLVQLSYRYNLAEKDKKPSFTIKHEVMDTPFPKLLKLKICATYVPGDESESKESNMALMEVYLPSGFTIDSDALDAIRLGKQVQRVETKNADTAIIIYFDYLEVGKEECVEVNAEKTHAVAKQKPAAITVYDYYNVDQRATVYYDVKSSLCDICEEGECGEGCEKKSEE